LLKDSLNYFYWRNCVSEFSKIKKEIPEKFIKVLKGETTIVPERRVTLNINDKLQFFPNGLFLKVIEELQNILVFRMESMSLLHN
jgi:hypothetical protein